MPAFTFIAASFSRFLGVSFPSSFPASIVHTSGDTTTLDITIGEHLYFAHSISANTDLRGKVVHFAPSMFAPINNMVGVWWEFIIPSSAAVNDIIVGTLLTEKLSVKNMSINLQIAAVSATSTTFLILMDTYAGMEMDGFQVDETVANHDRFLKNSELNPNELDNGNYGDYFHSDGVSPSFGLYYWAIEAVDQNNAELIPYIEMPAGVIYVRGRFYNKDFDDAPPSIDTPVFEIFTENGSAVLDNFSKLENVTVKFKATFPAAPIANSGVVYLIRTNAANNALDFIQNYETGEARITAIGGAGVINQGINSPSTTWTSLGSGIYQITFHVDKDHLDTAGLYRLVVIAYATDAYDSLNSFISDEFAVNEIPTCTDITTTYGVKDIKNHDSTNVKTCVQDRLIIYDKGNYADTSVWIGLLQAKTDPSLIITPGEVSMEIYTEQTLLPGGSIFKQVYETQTLNFQNWIWDAANSRFYANYGSPANLVWGFINQEDMFYSSDGLSLTEWNDMLYHFRCRYEGNIPNIADYLDGIQLPVPTSNQNWAGRTLMAHLTVTMNYSFTKDGIPYAYCDIHQFEFQIEVIDYENNTGFTKLALGVPTFMDSVGAPITDICAVDLVVMRATNVGGMNPLGSLIGFLDRASFGINKIEEEEPSGADADFPVLTSNAMTPLASDWFGGDGDIEVDLTQINQANVFRTSIMYKKP